MAAIKQKMKRRKSTDFVIDNNYRILKKIGSGSFGHIYLAESFQDRQEYAVKLEDCNSEYPQLEHEKNIYKSLQVKEKSIEIWILFLKKL